MLYRRNPFGRLIKRSKNIKKLPGGVRGKVFRAERRPGKRGDRSREQSVRMKSRFKHSFRW
jgi:hypothetical protein